MALGGHVSGPQNVRPSGQPTGAEKMEPGISHHAFASVAKVRPDADSRDSKWWARELCHTLDRTKAYVKVRE